MLFPSLTSKLVKIAKRRSSSAVPMRLSSIISWLSKAVVKKEDVLVFSSTVFIFGFLPICLIGYYVMPSKLKNGFLLVMSLGFYAWGEPSFVALSFMVNATYNPFIYFNF